jgi:pimeloyl-ACP methyl ester carboxylesterase
MEKSKEQTPAQTKKFNWRWFFRAAAICVLLVMLGFYICMSPYFGSWAYDKVLFHPEKKTDGPWKVRDIAGHTYEDVYFNSKNGSKLHGWYFDTPGAKYTVLFNHGNGANLSYRGEELALLLKNHVNILTYDYQGYGLSEGEPTQPKVLQDSRAAYDYLVETKHISPDRIIIFGESLGTAIAGNLASKVKCAGVILQCPLASVKRRGVELLFPLALYPDFLWVESGLSNVSKFAGDHEPLLMIAGTIDPMIPIAHADDLYNAASQPKTYVRVEGAGHTGDEKLLGAPEYARALKEFIANLDKKS